MTKTTHNTLVLSKFPGFYTPWSEADPGFQKGGSEIEGEARIKGAKRPRIEGKARSKGEAREKSGGGVWGGGSVSPSQKIFENLK